MIKYNFCDINKYLQQYKPFTQRFSSPIKIKSSETKISYIVHDSINNDTVFLKIKLNTIIDENEIKIYDRLTNESIYLEKIIEHYKDEQFYYIISEYIQGINLFDYQKQRLDCSEILNIYNELSKGIKEMHKMKIIHNDIKMENIMIYNNRIKIIDFESACLCECSELDRRNKNLLGTINYISPESYDIGIYSKKSDLWSFGIIMYILITNKLPYTHKINKIYNLYISNGFKNLDLDYLDNFKQEDYEFYNNILLYTKNLLSFKDKDRKLSIK